MHQYFDRAVWLLYREYGAWPGLVDAQGDLWLVGSREGAAGSDHYKYAVRHLGYYNLAVSLLAISFVLDTVADSDDWTIHCTVRIRTVSKLGEQNCRSRQNMLAPADWLDEYRGEILQYKDVEKGLTTSLRHHYFLFSLRFPTVPALRSGRCW